MAYIDCDKCSHGKVCAYRHQYDDHIVTCSHWKPADDKAEFERLREERERLLKECKKCGRKTQKTICKLQMQIIRAKAEAFKEFAVRLKAKAKVNNLGDSFVYTWEISNLVKEMTEGNQDEIRKDMADM